METYLLGRDNAAKDEKIDMLRSQLEDSQKSLAQERAKSKTLATEVDVLKCAFHEKKISKKEIDRITEQVRSSGFSGRAVKDKAAPALPLPSASTCIEMEIEELISRLATAEARVQITEEHARGLEEKNRELTEQRNQHMKHTEIVLKDKIRLAEELQSLKLICDAAEENQ